MLQTDYFLPLFGLSPKLGPIANWGLNIEKNAINVDTKDYSTNIKGIYLAGVICGGMETHKWFIENSRIHAKIIIENMLKTKNAK